MVRFVKTPRNFKIFAGFIPFLLLLILSGFLGIYSLNQSFNDANSYIESINLAREIQVQLQHQFHNWKTIILEGDRFSEYRKRFHQFSYNAQDIQNLLFNLKLRCDNFEGIPPRIEEYREEHKKLTNEYLTHIVNLEETNFKNQSKIIEVTQGKEEQALHDMDVIVNDIINIAHKKIENINKYYIILTFFSFSIITISALIMSIYIARRLIRSHHELEEKVRDRTAALTEANRNISLSEQKYRVLVEGSNDIIFSLNENFEVLTINRAVKKQFNISPERLLQRNFMDLVYEDDSKTSVTRQFVREKLELFQHDKNPVTFKAEFKSPNIVEPKEMTISLEYIDIDGKTEIFGKASRIPDDTLMDYFISEKQNYSIGNSLIAAEDITFRITTNLKCFMKQKDVLLLRIALREMIINAIEHGNLGVSFDEKSQATLNDNYFEYIMQRQNDPRFKNKRVNIEYMIKADRAVYKITDEGDGFDHQSHFNKDADDPNENMLMHGRGITMTREIFDRIEYNKKGNQVLLVKYFS